MENKDNILIEEIKKIAKKAGDKIMKIYNGNFDVMKKAENQPVTEADLVSNKIIIKELQKFGYPILSEESKDDKSRLKSEFVWIVDPMDGTSDFVGRTGEFSVMIGLVKNNEPILGVVYEPVSQKYYFAEKNKGAFIEQNRKIEKIKVSKKIDFSKMRILVSRNHLGKTEIELSRKLNLKKKTQGSAGLKLVKIAAREAEIYATSTDKMYEWDTCAGYIIIKEAGGKMTDISGDQILYNQENLRHKKGFVATNGVRHGEIIKELKKII